MRTSFPTPEMVASFDEALKRGYIRTRLVSGSWLANQWYGFCVDHQYPYINVHEARKGRSKIEIKLPVGDTFTETQKHLIKRIGEEVGIKAPGVMRTLREPFYFFDRGEKYLWLGYPVATDIALFFAEKIAHMFIREGKYGSLVQS